MSIGIVLASALLAAQPAAAASAEAAGASAAQGVTSYPPEFFASRQPTTALDMVSRLPGFTFDKGDTVRGFAGAAGNVLIDGARPASKEDTLDEILRRIPASQVARIDVIRGGAPGVDMQGKTVIANVVRRGDGGGHLTVAISGTYPRDGGKMGDGLRVEGSRKVGVADLEASLVAGRGLDDGAGDGSRVRRDGGGQVIQHAKEISEGDAVDVHASASAEAPLAGGKLRVSGYFEHNPYRYRQDDFVDAPPPPSQETEILHDNVDRGEAGVRYSHPLGTGSVEIHLLQQLKHEFISDAFASPGFDADFALDQNLGESILRTVVKQEPNPKLALEFGAEGAFNWLTSRTAFSEDGAPVVLPAANVRVEEKRGEAFATATWRPHPKLTVEAGLRIEASQISSSGDLVLSNKFVFPKPRLVATWSPDAADQFRARFEREVGQLNFGDFVASSSQLNTGTVRTGNPDLTPPQAWVLEAAYEHRFWGGAQVGVTGRHYALAQVIDRIPVDNTFDAPGNIGGGTKDEVALTLTLPTDKLHISGGQLQVTSTWRHSSVTDPTTHQQREISGLHPIDWEAHYTQGIPRLKTTVGFDVFGAYRETYYGFQEIDTQKLRTYVTLFAEYKPRPDIILRAEVRNATARGNEHIREVYAGPRGASPLSYAETRDQQVGQFFYFQARKTFG